MRLAAAGERGWDWVYWATVIAVCAVLFAPMVANDWIYTANFDVTNSLLPISLVTARSLRCGEWPQWNPDIFCGTPLIMSVGNYCFYPPTLLVSMLEPRAMLRAMTGMIPLHMLGAAWTARACAGAFIRSRFWAAYAALAYWLSLTLFQELLVSPNGNGYLVWLLLPWWGYALRTAARRTITENILLQGVILTWLLLGGMIQWALYALGCGVIIGVSDAAARHRSWPAVVRCGSVMFLAIGIAVLSAGIRLVPLAATIMHTDQKSGLSAGQSLARYAIAPKYLVRFFAPFFFGWSEDVFIGPVWGESFGVFAGTLTAALALAGLVFGGASRASLPWVVLFLVILAVALGTPLAAGVHALTGGQSLPFRRLAFFLVLPLAVLAGQAGQRWESTISGHRIRSGISFVLAAVGGMQFLVWGGFSAAEKHTVAGATAYTIVWMLLALGISLLFIVAGEKRTLCRTVVYLFLVLELTCCAQLLITNTTNEAGALLAPMPMANPRRDPAVAPRDGRVMAADGPWWGSKCIFAGWYGSGGYDNISPVVISELYSGGRSLDREQRRGIMPQTQRLWQLTATQWHVNAWRDGWQPVADPLPRIRMVFAYDLVNSRAAAIQRVLADDFPIHARVVVEDTTGLPASNGAIPAGGWTAAITAETPNSVTVATAAARAGLLVLADTYYDGWEALVDGRRRAILRVNSAFRGVVVDAGTHTVRFIYRQPGLQAGWFTSAGGFLCLLLLLGLALMRRWSGNAR